MGSISTYEFSRLDGDVASSGVEDVLTHAYAQAEQVRAQAHAEGFAAGHAEALTALAQQAAPALAALADAAGAVNAVSDEAVEVLQQQAAELALTVAQHILSGALAVQPERVIDICRGALRRLSDRQQVTILVNPDDLDILNAEADVLCAELGGIDRFEVQADRRIDRGGVVVRTDMGEVDTTIPTQLARAREVVMDALTAQPEEHFEDDPDGLFADSADSEAPLRAPASRFMEPVEDGDGPALDGEIVLGDDAGAASL